MKIDLMKFVENNKKIEDLRQQAKKKTEINRIIAELIENKEFFFTNEKELLDEIGIKYSKNDTYSGLVYNQFNVTFTGNADYKFKFTKENIKKIQKFIDKENE